MLTSHDIARLHKRANTLSQMCKTRELGFTKLHSFTAYSQLRVHNILLAAVSNDHAAAVEAE